jgi:heterodisulfide reductase subunit D
VCRACCFQFLCAHERDRPFKIVNMLEIAGASMGLSRATGFKHMKTMQDADAIVADCKGVLAARNIDAAEGREIVIKAMLSKQPLPLGRR